MLRWHYRSRHQSLIAVSNRQFYESKLYIVPSPYKREVGMGLSFRHVPEGVFDSRGTGSGTGTNPVEAKLLAEEVNRVFQSYDAIVDHCCHAWNQLVDQPWRVMSIGLRDWAMGWDQ